MNTKLTHNSYLAEEYSRTERPSDCMDATKNAPWKDGFVTKFGTPPLAMVYLPLERYQLASYERCNHVGRYSPHRCSVVHGEAHTTSNRAGSRGLWSRPSPEKQEKADLKMIREAVRAFLGLPKHRQHEVLVTVKLIKSTDPMPSSLGTDLVDCIRPLREDRKALVEFHGLVVETKSTINR